MRLLACLLCCALLLPLCLHAQVGVNLVPNPSFEEYTRCPDGPGMLSWDGLDPFPGFPRIAPTGWINPTHASPDYFNACAGSIDESAGVPLNEFGYQFAKSGVAYCGLGPTDCGYPFSPCINYSYSEYVQCKLIKKLTIGNNYQLSLCVSHSDYSIYYTNAIMMLLSVNQPTQTDDNRIVNTNAFFPISDPFLIDTANWNCIIIEFNAAEAYEFLTIGCFAAFQDTNVKLVLGNPSGIDGDSYVYIDDVELIQTDSTLDNADSLFIPNIITPNGDGINDVFAPSTIQPYALWIYNRWGQLIHSGQNVAWRPQLSDIEGVYFYSVSILTYSITQIRSGTVLLVR